MDRVEDQMVNESGQASEPAIPGCAIDYDSRTILPGEQARPALVVALDYDGVIPRIRTRDPFPALVQLFDAQLGKMAEYCSQVMAVGNLCQVSDEPTDEVSPYWHNDFFTGSDARLAYGITRIRNPAVVLEIGSGNSTRFFRKAIKDGGLRTRLISIDPSPRVVVEKIADEIMPMSVQEVPLATFANLQAGDILFFDGSHLCFHGSDVTHFFLRILPEVPKGVLVHVHDIRLPYDYPEHFDTRYYNEQYLLAAFLLYNQEWSAVLPVHYLAVQGVLNGDGGSFWIARAGST